MLKSPVTDKSRLKCSLGTLVSLPLAEESTTADTSPANNRSRCDNNNYNNRIDAHALVETDRYVADISFNRDH